MDREYSLSYLGCGRGQIFTIYDMAIGHIKLWLTVIKLDRARAASSKLVDC